MVYAVLKRNGMWDEVSKKEFFTLGKYLGYYHKDSDKKYSKSTHNISKERDIRRDGMIIAFSRNINKKNTDFINRPV